LDGGRSRENSPSRMRSSSTDRPELCERKRFAKGSRRNPNPNPAAKRRSPAARRNPKKKKKKKKKKKFLIFSKNAPSFSNLHSLFLGFGFRVLRPEV
jgi:hypothetical protein